MGNELSDQEYSAIQAAIELENSNDFAGALRLLEELILTYAKNSSCELRYRAALIAYRLQNFEKAATYFECGVPPTVAPEEMIRAELLRVDTYRRTDDHERAGIAAERVLEVARSGLVSGETLREITSQMQSLASAAFVDDTRSSKKGH